MMKPLLFLLTLIASHSAVQSQTFIAYKPKNCSYTDGEKIKNGDTLTLQSSFTVAKKGSLQLMLENGQALFCTEPGIHRVDTLFAALQKTTAYRRHDSVYMVLKTNNIYKCSFPYTLVCEPLKFGGYATRYADRIDLDGVFRTETAEPTMKLKWNYPVPYEGKYFILVTDLFGDFLNIYSTAENTFELPLVPLKPAGVVLYRIISGECRESEERLIVMK